MGMYDTINVEVDPRFVCKNGHRISNVQTKEFDCNLNTYRLTNKGRLVLTVDRSVHSREGLVLEGDWYIECVDICEECSKTTPNDRYSEFTITIRKGVVAEVKRHDHY